MREGSEAKNKPSHVEEVDDVVIRFAGDSGDGMQMTGGQFADTSAVAGDDISTLPDFPAEIRAPAGSLPGVSAYQLHFSSRDIFTPGDEPGVLVAMNPAALKVNLPDLAAGGRVIVNVDAFTEQNLDKAGYASDPLTDGSLGAYEVFKIPVSSLNARALAHLGLPKRQVDQCRNFWVLGLTYWLYDRPLEPTEKWIERRFAEDSRVALANRTALLAGWAYGDAGEVFTTHYQMPQAAIEPGSYRKVTGNEAMALGCLAASQLAGTPLFYAGYPITPASEILHELSRRRNMGVKTIQCEDEIASVGAAIGAAFSGSLAVTATSGPGLSLMSEAIGLAVMVELPLVVLDIQRAGPSTSMPTKPEQADLLQAMFGRHGECPLAILAPASPSDCFAIAIEAFRIAVKYMVPVIVLSDGYLANGAEPWKLPAVEGLPPIPVRFRTDPKGFQPYARDPDTLARPWALPGTPGLEHRVGGLEKANLTGEVSYDPANHWLMTELRQRKVIRIAEDIPPLEVQGSDGGDLLVLGWGGTYGAITAAGESARAQGLAVSTAHLRYLNPFPKNLGEVLSRFDRVLIPEMNLGQLRMLIRARFLVEATGLNEVSGRPIKVSAVSARIGELVRGAQS